MLSSIKFINIKLLFYFQSAVTLTILYVKRQAISTCLKEAKKSFWNVEDVELSTVDKAYFEGNYRRIKITCYALILCCICFISSIFLPYFFMKEKGLPFRQYHPPWMSINALIVLKFIVLTFGLVSPPITAMTMLMTLFILTRLQFVLLNRTIKGSLHDSNDVKKDAVQKIVDHHNFLLG